MTSPPPAARRGGPPTETASDELVESGYHFETEAAPALHDGLNLTDLAHVLSLVHEGILDVDRAAPLLRAVLAATEMSAAEFGYDPHDGEPYNSREKHFAARLGALAGWLNAGRTRRESVRTALRLHVRSRLADLRGAALDLAAACTERAEEHRSTLVPDYTYLQQAQPTTFGHYLLSFVYPLLRGARRLAACADDLDGAPTGVGAVNGSRLVLDRAYPAGLLGFGGPAEHTRDAMWATDVYWQALATATALLTTQDQLAEDLEIYSSSEFNFVDLADRHSRSSIAMPQKRNPYALTVIRGASGMMIGALTGFAALGKAPSARSDHYIYAAGHLPRALDLAVRVTRLSAGVVAGLVVHAPVMDAAARNGYAQATDLASVAVTLRGVDYRTAHRIVGTAVRRASVDGVPGGSMTGAMLDSAARELGEPEWRLTDEQVADALDPRRTVEARTGVGSAAPASMRAMVDRCRAEISVLSDAVAAQAAAMDRARAALLAQARRVAYLRAQDEEET